MLRCRKKRANTPHSLTPSPKTIVNVCKALSLDTLGCMLYTQFMCYGSCLHTVTSKLPSNYRIAHFDFRRTCSNSLLKGKSCPKAKDPSVDSTAPSIAFVHCTDRHALLVCSRLSQGINNVRMIYHHGKGLLGSSD